MDVSRDRVIVICNTVGIPPEVYHRDFPEIRAQAPTPAEAAGGLLMMLKRALDSALTHWRQETLLQAVADVEEFLKTLPPLH